MRIFNVSCITLVVLFTSVPAKANYRLDSGHRDAAMAELDAQFKAAILEAFPEKLVGVEFDSLTDLVPYGVSLEDMPKIGLIYQNRGFLLWELFAFHRPELIAIAGRICSFKHWVWFRGQCVVHALSELDALLDLRHQQILKLN